MPGETTTVQVPQGPPVKSTEPDQMTGAVAHEGSSHSRLSHQKEHHAPAGTGATEDSVEVVLGDAGTADKVVESPDRPTGASDPSIFRHPQPVHPHHAMHPRGGPPPPGYVHSNGSYGYRHGEYPPYPRAYPAPPQAASGSFDDQGSYPHPTPHYSPHVQYPPQRYPSDDVNVISPNHKDQSPHYRQPITPRPRHVPPGQPYYQYPPTSPVSRPEGASSGAPRLRNYAMRRGENSYARAQREGYTREAAGWSGAYPPPPPTDQQGRRYPQVVTESFDSEHYSRGAPPTPSGPPPPPAPPSSHDPHYQFYGGGGSWGSFDSAAPPPPPHFDDQRYYGMPPPDSPYSLYPPYSPGGIYRADSFPLGPYGGPASSFAYSYDEDDHRFLQDYHGGDDKHHMAPGGRKGRKPSSMSAAGRNMVLPKAAEEVDFEVTDPPPEPITPPSEEPVCESLADVNSFDVLCGRGGGTNSQIGNRRFRKLVQEFQPTYLMAKRKEKPLLARTIVLVIRKRGGRFLKKDEETGALFEVGDTKAEAKTSQALREGLDVRATRSAANSLSDKKKKKKAPKSPNSKTNEAASPGVSPEAAASENKERRATAESPPTLPRLQGEEQNKAGVVHPHSPEQEQIRKRRRMRVSDQFFPDFCPPRADLGRPASPSLADEEDDGVLDQIATPIRRNNTRDEDSMQVDNESVPAQGCAGIALDLVTGAATGSFCLGPSGCGWKR